MSFLSSVFGCGDVDSDQPHRSRDLHQRGGGLNKDLTSVQSRPPPLPNAAAIRSTARTSPPRTSESNYHRMSTSSQAGSVLHGSAYPHSRRPSLRPPNKPYGLQKQSDVMLRSASQMQSLSPPQNSEMPTYMPSTFQDRAMPSYYPQQQMNPGYRYPMPLAYQPIFVPPPPMDYGHFGQVPPGAQPYPVPADWIIYPSQFPSAQAQQRSYSQLRYHETGQVSPSSLCNRNYSEVMSPAKMEYPVCGNLGFRDNIGSEQLSTGLTEPPKYSIVSPNPCTVINNSPPPEKREMWSQTNPEDMSTCTSDHKSAEIGPKLTEERTSSTGHSNSIDIRSDDSQFSETIPRLSPKSDTQCATESSQRATESSQRASESSQRATESSTSFSKGIVCDQQSEAARFIANSMSPPRPKGSLESDAPCSKMTDEDPSHKKCMNRFVTYIPETTVEEFYVLGQTRPDGKNDPGLQSRPVHCVNIPLYQVTDRVNTLPDQMEPPAVAKKFIVREEERDVEIHTDTPSGQNPTELADQTTQDWKALCSIASGACSCQSCSGCLSAAPALLVTKMTLPQANSQVSSQTCPSNGIMQIVQEPRNPFSPVLDEEGDSCSAEPDVKTEFKFHVDRDINERAYSKSPGPLRLSVECALQSQRNRIVSPSRSKHDICQNEVNIQTSPLRKTTDDEIASSCKPGSVRALVQHWEKASPSRSSTNKENREKASMDSAKMSVDSAKMSVDSAKMSVDSAKTSVDSVVKTSADSIPKVSADSANCESVSVNPFNFGTDMSDIMSANLQLNLPSAKMIDRSLDSQGRKVIEDESGAAEEQPEHPPQRLTSHDIGTMTDICCGTGTVHCQKCDCGKQGEAESYCLCPNEHQTRRSTFSSFSPMNSMDSRSVTVSVFGDYHRPGSYKIHDKVDLQLQVELRMQCSWSSLVFLRMKKRYYAVIEPESLESDDSHIEPLIISPSGSATPNVGRSRTLDFYSAAPQSGRESAPCHIGSRLSHRPSLYSRTVDDLPPKVLCFVRVDQTLGQLRMCLLDRSEVKRHFGWKALKRWLYYGNVTVLDSTGAPTIRRSASVSFDNVDRQIPTGGNKVWMLGQFVRVEVFLRHIQFVNRMKKMSTLRGRRIGQ